MGKKKFAGMIAFVIASLLLIYFFVLLLLPGEVVDRTVGEGQLHVETSRSWLMFPWECYDLRWSFTDTQSVMLDGWGVASTDSIPACLNWGNIPQFEIYHLFNVGMTDGTTIDVPVIQHALFGRIEFWVGLVLFVILIFAADRLGISPWRSVWLRQKLRFLLPPLPSLPESPLTKRERWFVAIILAVIIVVGLVFRVSMIYRLGESNYQAWAARNYYGGLTEGYVGLANPATAANFANVYPPGYPFMLYGLGNLGLDLTAIRIIQSLIDVSAVIAIYLTLRRVKCSLWLAILASAVYALYPSWSAGSAVILGEWIMPTAIAWTAFLLLVAADTPSYRWWTFAGMLIGVTLTFRPEGLIIIGLAGLWLLWQRWTWKRMILSGVALLFGFGIFATIVGLKNLAENGVFTVSSSAGGYALWSGLGQLPNDYGYIVSDRLAGERMSSLGIPWNSPEANRYFLNEYFTAWREHPSYVVSSIILRVHRILSEQDGTLFNIAGMSAWAWLTNWSGFWATWGFLIIVTASLMVLRNKRRLFLLLFPLMLALIANGIVYYEPRYVRYAALSYLMGSAFIVDSIYVYFLKFSYAKIPQLKLKPERISLLLSIPILLAMGFLAIGQTPPLIQFATGAHQATLERVAFTPENRTPVYQMNDLTWMPAPNAQFDAAKGWQITFSPEAPTGTTLWTPISLDQVSMVTVQMHIQLVRGRGYVSVGDMSGEEFDQQRFVVPGDYDVVLAADTVGQSLITINALTLADDSLMIIQSVAVYTKP